MMTEEREAIDERARSAGRRPGRLTAIVVAVMVLIALLVVGAWPRIVRGRQLTAAAQARAKAVPSVAVAEAKKAPAELELTFPGNVQALTETTLYARADGYVSRRLVDIGDRVRQGQLLAQIESPEFDQQVNEARATLQRARAALKQAEAASSQTEANLRLAEITANRWVTLAGKGVLSRQDGDEKQAALDARRADAAASAANVQAARETVAANEATVRRLEELQSFRQVRAPFGGVVTARTVDVGSLVSAGSNSSVRELFRLAQLETLRVFVMVPQADAGLISPGLTCRVEVADSHGASVAGTVTRTANALDPASRTLLTEVQVANPGGQILPGSYATVQFKVVRSAPPVLVPTAALRQTDKGSMVAVLQEGGVVHLQTVTPGRDNGAHTEIVKGLKPGQRVVTTWTDAVKEGAKVAPLASPPPSPAGGAKPGGPGR